LQNIIELNYFYCCDSCFILQSRCSFSVQKVGKLTGPCMGLWLCCDSDWSYDILAFGMNIALR